MKKTLISTLFLLILLFNNSLIYSQLNVSTIVGPLGGRGHEDGSGTDASFFYPDAICSDLAGNVYVADNGRNTIRQITPSGVVTTLAGTPGSSGYIDATGAAARFYNPNGICINSTGDIYVADTYNQVIRRVTSAGVVTTFAGTGSVGSIDGVGSSATFNYPQGMCFDPSGNLYVIEPVTTRIRKITSAGVVSTFAISSNFTNARTICSDASGNIYVAAININKILKYTPLGVQSVFAGSGAYSSIDGTGTAASFTYPYGICSDASNNIFVSDRGSYKIRKITPGAVVTTFAGSGSLGVALGAGSIASFNPLASIGADGLGNVFVSSAPCIRKMNSSGFVSILAGGGGFGSQDLIGNNASFSNVQGIAIDASNNLIVADLSNNKIRKVTTATLLVSTIAGTGSSGTDDGSVSVAKFSAPSSVCLDPSGNIYVADYYNHMIRKISGGVVTTFAGTGAVGSTDGAALSATFNYPYDLCFDSFGNLYVSDTENNKIRKITPSGVVSTFAGSGSAGSADGIGALSSFDFNKGISIDANNNLYVAEYNSNKIRKISPSGLVSTFAGSGSIGSLDASGTSASFNHPSDVCIDGLGNVYVADSDNNKIRKITATGVVTTIAGSTYGYIDGSELVAKFNSPVGIAIDGASNIYVTSDGSNNIRKIAPACLTPTITPSVTNSVICLGSTVTFNAVGANTYTWTGGVINNVAYTPTSVGTLNYTVTGVQTGSCNLSNTSTISITVNPPPTIAVNSGSICTGSSFTITPTGASVYTYSGGSAFVNPTNTTSYTVTGASAAGCTNTAVSNVAVTNTVSPSILLSIASTTICGTSAAFNSTITNGGTSPLYQWKKNGVNVGSGLTSYSPTSLVNGDVVSCILTSNATCATPTSVVSNSITMTVGATPTITVNSGSICSGSSFTFNPTGASTYAYSGGNAIVNPTSNTSYTVTGTSVAGCTNSAVSNVTVNALPILTATTNNSLICTGSTATLSVLGAMSYTWNTGSNLASYPVTPTTTTSYTVIGTDGNGCTNNAVVTQSVSLCTGIDEIMSENLTSIYPNPNNGVFTISTQKDAQLIIVNQLGEIVLQQLITSGENKLDLQNQATGLYFVKISAQGSLTTFKVMKL